MLDRYRNLEYVGFKSLKCRSGKMEEVVWKLWSRAATEDRSVSGSGSGGAHCTSSMCRRRWAPAIRWNSEPKKLHESSACLNSHGQNPQDDSTNVELWMWLPAQQRDDTVSWGFVARGADWRAVQGLSVNLWSTSVRFFSDFVVYISAFYQWLCGLHQCDNTYCMFYRWVFHHFRISAVQ